MKKQERFIAYTLLIAVCAMLLARPLASTAVAKSLLAELLGPTDGVVLSQGEDKENLTLTARDDHLATGENPFSQVYRVAVCDVLTVVQQLVQRPSMREELDAFTDSENDRLTKMRDELDQLRMAGESEIDATRRAQIAQEFQQRLQQYQQAQRTAMEEQDRIKARLMVQSYDLVKNAIAAVCKEVKVDLVITTRDPELELEQGATAQVLTDILSRTAVHYPAEIDITAEVLDELNL